MRNIKGRKVRCFLVYLELYGVRLENNFLKKRAIVRGELTL